MLKPHLITGVPHFTGSLKQVFSKRLPVWVGHDRRAIFPVVLSIHEPHRGPHMLMKMCWTIFAVESVVFGSSPLDAPQLNPALRDSLEVLPFGQTDTVHPILFFARTVFDGGAVKSMESAPQPPFCPIIGDEADRHPPEVFLLGDLLAEDPILLFSVNKDRPKLAVEEVVHGFWLPPG